MAHTLAACSDFASYGVNPLSQLFQASQVMPEVARAYQVLHAAALGPPEPADVRIRSVVPLSPYFANSRLSTVETSEDISVRYKPIADSIAAESEYLLRWTSNAQPTPSHCPLSAHKTVTSDWLQRLPLATAERDSLGPT